MRLTNYAAARIIRALPRAAISNAAGALASLSLPAPIANVVTRGFSAAFGADLSEAQSTDFRSFDAFFTRSLKEGLRPIDPDPKQYCSPADGKIVAAGTVSADLQIRVKGQTYGVAELIGDTADATRYDGGSYAVVYLSPRDYHRVHAPTSGTVTMIRSMPGDFFPVNRLGEDHVPGLFTRNRRVAIVIERPGNQRCTVVMVAALIVGRITVSGIDAPDVAVGWHTISPARAIDKGAEIGMFHLGSTAVVFAEAGLPAWDPGPRPIRMGETLGLGGRA